MRRGKAKVSWEASCLPKNEGGLGIRRLELFNVALITSHIWSILTLKESIWVYGYVHINFVIVTCGNIFLEVTCRGDGVSYFKFVPLFEKLFGTKLEMALIFWLGSITGVPIVL